MVTRRRLALAFWRNQVDGPAARGCATRASDLADLLRESIVDGQFFAGLDRAPADIENVPFEDSSSQVGIATMVDDFGAAAADRAVQRPVIIQGEQVGEISLTSFLCLAPADPLAGVFDDFVVGRDLFERVDTALMDLGLADFQPEIRVPGIDGRGSNEAGHAVFDPLF